MTSENISKKQLACFGFQNGDIDISYNFYKIEKFKKCPVFPIITTDLILSLIPGPLTKLKNSTCDKTENSNWDKTKKTNCDNLKNSNCDKLKKRSNCEKTIKKKLKF